MSNFVGTSPFFRMETMQFHTAQMGLFLRAIFFWGELIDKYKDINANSKTVFTDYAMLKLVHIVPIYFYYSVNQRWAWLKNSSQLRKLGPSWYLLPYRYKACWKPAKSKREFYVTNIGHCQFVIYIFPIY